MNVPSELSAEEIWHEKMTRMKEIEAQLWETAEILMKKGRIHCEDRNDPDMNFWSWNILPEIFEARLKGKRENWLSGFAAFHPLIGSTTHYDRRKPFDLPGDAIQKCAENLLQELREANKSSSTEVIVF